MRRVTLWAPLSVCLLFFSCVAAAGDRALSFEDRVKAQEAIERIYYRHQVGATEPFEATAWKSIIERKVRLYLKNSVALERLWKTRVTREMLYRELERMAIHTRMPERDGNVWGSACDNCPAVANDSQVDFDNDGLGDVCDLTLVSPESGSIFFLGGHDSIPTFVWRPGGSSVFAVEFSSHSNFSKPRLRSAKKFKPSTSWTPSIDKWRKIQSLGRGAHPIYWRIVGKLDGSSVKEYSDHIFEFIIRLETPSAGY